MPGLPELLFVIGITLICVLPALKKKSPVRVSPEAKPGAAPTTESQSLGGVVVFDGNGMMRVAVAVGDDGNHVTRTYDATGNPIS